MERVRWSCADEIGGDEVFGAVAATAPLSDQRRTEACERRAPVFQHVDQIPAYRCMGDRRAGSVPLENVRRYVARRQPRHPTAELLALRYVCGGQDRQELDRKTVRL